MTCKNKYRYYAAFLGSLIGGFIGSEYIKRNVIEKKKTIARIAAFTPAVILGVKTLQLVADCETLSFTF